MCEASISLNVTKGSVLCLDAKNALTVSERENSRGAKRTSRLLAASSVKSNIDSRTTRHRARQTFTFRWNVRYSARPLLGKQLHLRRNIFVILRANQMKIAANRRIYVGRESVISCLSADHQDDDEERATDLLVNATCRFVASLYFRCERTVAALRRASPGSPKSLQPWITRARPAKRRSPSTGSPGARKRKTPPAIPKCVFE